MVATMDATVTGMKQFNRQQDSRDGCAEHRRHAGGGACHQQRLALGRGEMEKLGEQRAQRAAGHDDGTLGAERAAGADRDGRGQRFEQRDLELDATAPDQDRLDGFGNAMAADLLGAEARHHSDDQAAHHRDGHAPDRQVRRDRSRRDRQPALIGQVGEQRDQLQQHPGGAGAKAADHGCHQGEL
jgi:hypothetical protein